LTVIVPEKAKFLIVIPPDVDAEVEDVVLSPADPVDAGEPDFDELQDASRRARAAAAAGTEYRFTSLATQMHPKWFTGR
jgi:hypothetical protein